MRQVVLPQALRRVLPPLLNDFVSLQKDTALVSAIGARRGRCGRPRSTRARDFNFTPYVVAALFFIAATIPLARFTDWLAVRSMRREQRTDAREERTC